MSWLFKALQSDDSDSDSSAPLHTPDDQPHTPTSSVKDDLSLFSQTLGRQIRGVASFLAPPPQSTPAAAGDVVSADSSDSSSLSSDALLGIRKDLVEIGGSLRTGFSLLSSNSNKAVGEISRLATNFLQFPDEPTEEEEEGDEDESTGDVPGITEEVIDFVTEMTSRPQFWTDFPLAVDYTDFTLSDVQKLHISAVEQLAPSLSALRVELQSSMSEERFWIIYFIMLLPRLDEHDFELLATPKIVEAREILMQKLQNKKNTQMDSDSNETNNLSEKDIEVNEFPEINMPLQEKNMTEVVRAAGSLGIHEEENPEKWLEEADIDTETSADGGKIFEHEEDVSFSDLEDDENDLSTRFSENKQGRNNKPSSPNESSDWVQLNEGSGTKGVQQKTGQSKEKDSEGEESNDWLTVDDF